MRHTLRLMTLLAASAIAGGCGIDFDERPAKWSFISATIVEPSCATISCHSDVAQRASVELDERNEGWTVLTSRRFVIPGNQTDSALMYLLRGEGNLRMPPDFALPNVDIELIGRWIDAGATNE
jgi:hypothetical protein